MEIISGEIPSEWDNFVVERSKNIFCTTLWAKIAQEGLKLKPIFYGLYEDSNLRGGIVMFEKSTKIGIKILASHGEPIISSKEEFDMLFRKISSENSRKIIKISSSPFWDRVEYFSGFTISPRATFIIDTTKPEKEIWSAVDKDAGRWAVRKAEKLGIYVIEAKTETELKEYYEKLCLDTRERIEIEPYPFEYLKKIREVLGEGCKLFIAKKGNEPIAGIMLMVFNGCATVCSVATSTENLKTHAGDLIWWHAISWSCKNKISYFDLSGIDPLAPEGSKFHKIFMFKKKWGGNLIKYNCYYKYPIGIIGGIVEKLRDALAYKIITPWASD